MENTLFSEKSLRLLKALNEYETPYMLVGMAAVALQGGGLVTEDVDLWVEDLASPAFRKALESAGAAYVAPTAHTPPMLAGDGMEVYDLVVHMSGLGPFSDEYRYVRQMPVGDLTLPVLGLRRIIRSKESAGRRKDQAVLPILYDLVKTIDSLESEER